MPTAVTGAAGHSIRRNAAFAVAAQFSSAAFTAVLTVYLARALDPAGYGLFALAVGFGALALLPSDLGISPSAARFIAEHRGDRRPSADVLADALLLKLVISGALCAALAGLAEPIAELYGEPGLTWPLRAVALALLGQNLFVLFTAALVALGRVDRQLTLYASESVVEFASSVLLVVLGAGATGAALGRAAGYVFGGLLGFALLARLLGARVAPRRLRTRGSARRIMRYAGPLLIVDAAFVLFEQVDVLIVGAFLGPAAAGVFQAPLRLTTFLHLLGTAAANAVAPRLAKNPREPQKVDSLLLAARGLIILHAALAAAVLAWADPLVNLVLGPEYEESSEVLRVLTPFVFLSGLGPLITLAVNYLGEAARRVPLVLAAVVVNVALDVALIPRIGVIGGAVATDVAYAIYLPAHLWLLQRLVPIDLRPLAWSTVRALVAGAAMAGTLAAVGTQELEATEWLLGAVAGPAVFVAALVVLRETTTEELGDARARVAAALRRR